MSHSLSINDDSNKLPILPQHIKNVENISYGYKTLCAGANSWSLNGYLLELVCSSLNPLATTKRLAPTSANTAIQSVA